MLEQVNVRFLGGPSYCFTRTIGVEQGFPLSWTHFKIYIDEITSFIALKGGNEVVIGGTQVSCILYAKELSCVQSLNMTYKSILMP